jgi:L-ectoine synthase
LLAEAAPRRYHPPACFGEDAMYTKSVNDLRAKGHEKVVANGSARTVRFITADDGIGFSMSDVYLKAGTENTLWYKNHWEANHILSGTGEVRDLTTGEVFKVGPGVCYVVGPKDRHSMKAITDLHLISIFNPPLRGDEQHDKDGTLPPTGPVPPGPKHQR